MDHVEQMPIWGLEKSLSSNPTARSIDLLGACSTPSTTILEYFLKSLLVIVFFGYILEIALSGITAFLLPNCRYPWGAMLVSGALLKRAVIYTIRATMCLGASRV